MNLYLPVTNYLSIFHIKRSLKQCGFWHTYHLLRAEGATKSTTLWGIWVALNSK
jgi:hypothetical protein